MRIKVYQIDAEKDSKSLSFENYRKAMSHGGVDPTIYQCVFHGDINGTGLDDVYEAFNTFDHPYIGTYQGYSLSVSDVVEVTAEQPEESPVETGCYFCDSIGWRKIEFDSTQCAEMNGIRVLMLLPGKAPVETRVVNELPYWQKAISCHREKSLIKVTSPFEDGVLVISNNEAKLHGMEGSRMVNEQIYTGPVFLANDDGNEKFCDLTDEQIAEYTDRFAQPKDICPEDVQKDVSFTNMEDISMVNNVPSTEKKSSPDMTVKFYCPLKVMLYEYDKYGNLDSGSESEYGGRFANRYEDRILECLEEYLEDDDMAKYFDGSNSAVGKLKSAVWGFESREGILYGCITATLTAPFTPEEEAEFKEWCVGQNADGLGEGAEQQEIEISDGVMYVSYWHSGDDYFLENEDEFEQRINGNMEMGGM